MKYYGTKDKINYGFYESNFDGAIEITDEYWNNLISAQGKGKRIILFNGSVIAVDEREYSKNNGVWVKLSPQEVEEKQLKIQNAIRIQELEALMEDIDKKRIRAIAEPSMKEDNLSWLEYYNNQIRELRNELIQLK